MSTTTAAADAAPSPTEAGIAAIPASDDLAHYAAVAAALREKEARRDRREFLKTLALCLAAPAIASGWVARELTPEVRQDVQFVPLMPDGTIASTHRWENLPPEVRGDVVVNTLWNYVRLRESYSHVGADYAWQVVSALSDEAMKKEYQTTNNPRSADSPWQRYGEKVRVEVSYDSHADLCSVQECKTEPEGYQFRFLRWEVQDGRRSRPQMYVAQVRFRRNVPGIDPRQRYTFNGPGIQVWEYVPGKPAGAQPAAGAPR